LWSLFFKKVPREVVGMETPNASRSGQPPQAQPQPITGAASLQNAVIPLSNLRDRARKELLDILDSVRITFYLYKE
jgi:hypothetical protein